MKPNQWTV